MKTNRGRRRGGRWALAVLLAVAPAAAIAAGDGESPLMHCPLEPGRSSLSVQVGGQTRRVEVEIGPQAGKSGPAPVVFLWHGWGSDPRNQLAASRLAKTWPEAVAIAPAGLGRRFPGAGFRSLPGWQVSAGEFYDRYLRLFDALVLELSQLECLDRDHFVSSGFSNGAFFSNLLGCERPAVLAAIAPVGGGGPYGDCESPLPVWIAHGVGDRVVPAREGRATFSSWREHNSCGEDDDGPAQDSDGCVQAPGCQEETVLCTFRGGHWWPRDLLPDWARFLKAQRRPAPKP